MGHSLVTLLSALFGFTNVTECRTSDTKTFPKYCTDGHCRPHTVPGMDR